MLKRWISLLAGSAMIAGVAAADPIKVDDLAKYPAVWRINMDTEGNTLAGVVHRPGSDGYDTAVATWDISGQVDTSKPLVPLAVTPGNDRMKLVNATALLDGMVQVTGNQAWTGPTVGCLEGRTTGAERTFVNKLYMTDKSLTDFDEMFAKPSAGRVNAAMEQCMRLQASTTSIELSLPLDDDHIVISRGGLDGTRYYKYNLRTQREDLLFRQTDLSPERLDPRTGEMIAASKIDPDGQGDFDIKAWLRNPQTGELEREPELEYKASTRFTMSVAGVDDETGRYFVITDKFRDKAAVYFYDAVTNQFSAEPVFAHPEFEATGVLFSPRKANFNQVVGFSYGGPTGGERYYIDPQVRAIYEGLQAAFPGKEIGLNGYNEDFSRVLFTVQSSAQPPIHYLLVDGAKVALIGAQRPWVDSDTLRETEFTSYEARDGLEIPAFLTLPKGWKKSDGPLPAIVLPHGGPWGRDDASWDATGWTQFLASRGYAVLQPQYRGSDGFGRKLWLAGDAEWGQKMQDDKDDGAAWMVSEGIAAQDRIAIFGYSYGGFAAMAATVRPNSPYQCAIAGAGVSNLAKLGNNWSNNRLQRAVQGNTVKGMDPMQNTDKANIPILVYHGDRDVRVPLYHGRDFYNGVKGVVPAKLVVIPDMPHSLPWWPEHHRESLTAIEDFLEDDCGPGGL